MSIIIGSRLSGVKVAFGLSGFGIDYATAPIINVPQGAMVLRRRIRSNGIAKAFVKTPNGITQWILGPADNGELQLLFPTAANIKDR